MLCPAGICGGFQEFTCKARGFDSIGYIPGRAWHALQRCQFQVEPNPALGRTNLIQTSLIQTNPVPKTCILPTPHARMTGKGSRTMFFSCLAGVHAAPYSSFFLAVLTGAAHLKGQAQGPRPRFESADIHASVKTINRNTQGLTGGLMGRHLYRRDSIVFVLPTTPRSSRFSGGPNWLEMEKYDLVAKVPTYTRPEGVRPMLQSLLADRFAHVVHEESRPLPAWNRHDQRAPYEIRGRRCPHNRVPAKRRFSLPRTREFRKLRWIEAM